MLFCRPPTQARVSVMETRYAIVKVLGAGAFGDVLLATVRKSGALVAIKTIKEKTVTSEECFRLREVQVLRNCQGHRNVVELLDLVHEDFTLHMMFEYMETNLFDLIHEYRGRGMYVPVMSLQSLARQLLSGLHHLHSRGFMHRGEQL